MTDPVQVFDGDGYPPCQHCDGTGWARNGWSCMGCGGQGFMNEKAKEHQKKVLDVIGSAGDTIKAATENIIGLGKAFAIVGKSVMNLNNVVREYYRTHVIVDPKLTRYLEP